MTTLNTIIEEEKKKFFDSLDKTAHRILYDKITAKQADELDEKAFTTAMQRAYEAGQVQMLKDVNDYLIVNKKMTLEEVDTLLMKLVPRKQ